MKPNLKNKKFLARHRSNHGNVWIYGIAVFLLMTFHLGCGGGSEATSSRLVRADLEYPPELFQISKDIDIQGTLFKTSSFTEDNKIAGPTKAIVQDNDKTKFEFSFTNVPDGTFYLEILFKNKTSLSSSKKNSVAKTSSETTPEQCEQVSWELAKPYCEAKKIEQQCKDAIKTECANDPSPIQNATDENTAATSKEDKLPILASLTARIEFSQGKNVHITFKQPDFNLSYDDDGNGITNLSEAVGIPATVNPSNDSSNSSDNPPNGSTSIPLPVPPSNLTVITGDGQNTIDWNLSSNVISYNLYWSTASGVSKINGTKIQAATKPFIHTGLNNGVTYYYVVTAVNSGGESVPSAQSSGMPVSPVAGQWTLRNSGSTAWLDDIAFGNNIFVVTSKGSSKQILTSSDGVQWTTHAVPNDYSTGIAYGNNLFVIVGWNGQIATSPDGISWTKKISGTTNYFYAVTYGNNTFVAVGDDGTVVTSPDGTTWIKRNSGIAENLRGIIYANNTFVAVGSNGKIIISTDGITWTSKNSGTTTTLSAIAYGNGTFVIVGPSFGVASTAPNILTSPDAVAWTLRNPYYLSDVTYAQNTFVAVGYGGKVLTSSDGITWVSRDIGVTDVLFSIVYGNTTFVAVGQNGKILTSH
ncbi:MAG: hypothetical protein HY877_01920 [Deltaproteobacteria bacterium]|nr:hypothetical protein [Deltaproteobacteria bacterium]